jgi:hypothetical protein
MSIIKYLALLNFFAIILISPLSAQNTVKYDEEIDVILKKIRQYPERTKDLEKLKENFELANKVDNDYLISILETGQPDIWLKMYNGYLKLDVRQKKVLAIPEKSIKLSGIKVEDYSRSLLDAKHKATAYFYAHGEKMLQSGNQADARTAYFDFMQVASLDGSYKELDKMLRKSILIGSSSVEFELINRTPNKITSTMAHQLTVIIRDFKKAKYGQEKPEQTDSSFVFILRIKLDEFEAGPDQFKELQYQEERDIYQGERVVDTIKCLVTETRQLKKARLSGRLEYVNKQSGQVVNSVPLKVESVFTNAYGSLQGNPDAAGDETLKLLSAHKADYPSADQMVSDATEEFSKKAKEIILSQ